jgi:NitT/TauT family transport system ATP-binding protein
LPQVSEEVDSTAVAGKTDKAGERPSVGVRFEDVQLTFGDGTHALDGVSLDVRDGEFVAIIGPSGCGKSTLLRIASGLESATGGRVECDHEHLGYVFQDPTLLPWRTAQANVELFAEFHGIPKRERAARAREALASVGLSGAEHKYPKSLSGGMRSRVSLARSLLLHPRVFLFDEPFAAIDEITRGQLNDQLIELFVEEQFAGIFVTHSIAEACFLASRIIVMSARPGRVLASVDVPYPYPRTPSVRFDPEFVETTKTVSALLRTGIGLDHGEDD